MHVPVIVYDMVMIDGSNDETVMFTMKTRTAVDDLLNGLKKLTDQQLVISSYVGHRIDRRTTTIQAETIRHAAEQGFEIDTVALDYVLAAYQQQQQP